MKKYTKDVIERVLACIQNNPSFTRVVVAEKCQVPLTLVYDLARGRIRNVSAVIGRRKGNQRLTAEDMSLATVMRSRGATYTEIGKHLGISKGHARRIALDGKRKESGAERKPRTKLTKGKIIERFLKLVRKGRPDACWLWQGMINEAGYGCYGGDLSQEYFGSNLAHRIIFEIEHGQRPVVVMHKCDNPPCCNLAHLLGGTHAENAEDCRNKGRNKLPPALQGGTNPIAKLSEDQVRKVILRLANGESQTEIATELNVSSSLITGEAWSHVSRELGKL